MTPAKVWIVMITWLCCDWPGVRANPVAPMTQQSLQAVLYSIEERLRGLDTRYASPGYASPRNWDVEQYVRRLDAVEGRVRDVEVMLQVRMDKIAEAVSSSQLKQTLAGDHMIRKIDSLYERLERRMGFMENRLDLDVAKIRTSVESGFSRMARGERDSESFIEVDLETQMQDLQRHLESFENNQNTSLSQLLEMSNRSCRSHELNDAGNEERGNVERDVDKKDMEQFAQSMENVATKVNKMVTDLSLRTQTMESLVKNSMSLSNATRREVQDGLRSLGLRIVYQKSKHNKEKESSFEFGWDALASLITKEFGNMASQLQTNQDKLVSAQDGFRNSCHRLQLTEQQLSATVAQVLDNMLDLIRNRSTDMSKQMVTFQEILKNHNSQMLHTTQAALPSAAGQQHKELQDGIGNILAGIKVIQHQINEMTASHPTAEDVKDECPDTSVIADKILATLTSKQLDTSQVNIDKSHSLIDKLISAINTNQSNREDRQGNRLTDSHVLDIIEQHIGDTLHYNVTQDNARVSDNGTEEANDYEQLSAETDKIEHLYDDEGEGNLDEEHLGVGNRNVSTVKQNVSREMSQSENVNGINTGKTILKQEGNESEELGLLHLDFNRMVATQSSGQSGEHKLTDVKLPPGEMITPQIMEVKTKQDEQDIRILKSDTEIDKSQTTKPTEPVFQSINKTEINRNIESINFSPLWHKMKNSTINNTSKVNSSDLSTTGSEVKLAKGQNENVTSTLNVGEYLQGADVEARKLSEDIITSSNQDLRILEQSQLHDDNEEYDYDK